MNTKCNLIFTGTIQFCECEPTFGLVKMYTEREEDH